MRGLSGIRHRQRALSGGITALLALCPVVAVHAESAAIKETPQLAVTLPAPLQADAPVSSGPLCTGAITVCARAMQPMDVAVGGSFTVRIEDHFSATFECALLNGKPRWMPTSEQGSCAAQPVIFLPAKYDADDPWNIG